MISPVSASILINEFVVDPQTDWNNSTGDPDNGDEWIEIYNSGQTEIDLTNWTLIMNDSLSVSASVQSLTGVILAESYEIILDPVGSMNLNGRIILYDDSMVEIDSVTYGNWDDGNTSDNAPDGNSDSTDDECLARIPNGQDIGVDLNDFQKVSCTYGISNSEEETDDGAEQNATFNVIADLSLIFEPEMLDFGDIFIGGFSILETIITAGNSPLQISAVNAFPAEQGGDFNNNNVEFDFNNDETFFKPTDFDIELPLIFSQQESKTTKIKLTIPTSSTAGNQEGKVVYTVMPV